MWLCGRIIKVKYTGKVRNDEVLTRLGEKIKLLKISEREKRLGWGINRPALSAVNNHRGQGGKRKGRLRRIVGAVDDIRNVLVGA